jgi:hypothetical protein
VCTTSLVDLSHDLTLTIGTGGTGGANGDAYIYDYSYGAEHGDPGMTGGETSVSNGYPLCQAEGGVGGEPGWHYATADLPNTPTYGGGGNSGAGILGGSAAGLEVGNEVVTACINQPWEYNTVASGGAGGQVGNTPSGNISGAGGNGTLVNSGAFVGLGDWAGGGGGGGGEDCHVTTTAGSGGSGGGGAGGSEIISSVISHAPVPVTTATAGQANTGGGGGGGAGSYLSTTDSYYGVGSPGAAGGTGFILIRFAEPTLNSAVYFATAKSKLTASAKSTLTTYATTAIADDIATVSVTGFADPRGGAAYNRALSKARAKAVATYLRGLFSAQSADITVTSNGRGVKSTYSNLARDRVVTISGEGGTDQQQP